MTHLTPLLSHHPLLLKTSRIKMITATARLKTSLLLNFQRGPDPVKSTKSLPIWVLNFLSATRRTSTGRPHQFSRSLATTKTLYLKSWTILYTSRAKKLSNRGQTCRKLDHSSTLRWRADLSCTAIILTMRTWSDPSRTELPNKTKLAKKRASA